jgi:protein TonB
MIKLSITRAAFLLLLVPTSTTFGQTPAPYANIAQSQAAQIVMDTGPVRLPSAMQPQESNEAAIKNGDWCSVYPPIAVRLGQEGEVALTFTLTERGTVTDVRLTSSSGHQGLDEVSARCAATWHFQPAMRNEKPVAVPWAAKFAYSLKPLTIRSRDQGGVQTEIHPQFPWSH